MSYLPVPLPHPLNSRPFLVTELPPAGISPHRVRRDDMTRVGPGAYCLKEVELTHDSVAWARAARWHGCAISGVSAARIYGMPLPHWLHEDDPLAPTHFIRVRDGTQPASHDIVLSRATVHEADVHTFQRFGHEQKSAASPPPVSIVTRARTWLSLARVVPFDALVAIADHLIRLPRPQFEDGRTEPYATLDELRELLDRYRTMTGVGIASRALDLARVGSDSVPETRARLGFYAAHLPEPALNTPLYTPRGVLVSIPDYSWTEHRVVGEYDGSHHRELATFTADRDKDAMYRSLGITALRLYSTDLPPMRTSESEARVLERLASCRAVSMAARALDQAKGRPHRSE